MCNEVETKEANCARVTSQTAKVCVPISIKPYARTGRVVVRCLGEMEIHHCPHCEGKVDGSCEFTVSQVLKIDIPVEFGATVKTGATYVQCGRHEADEKDALPCGCEETQPEEEK